MREFYFEDKSRCRFFIGSQPKDDINCNPFDYFLYNYAHTLANLHLQIATHHGNGKNLQTDIFYHLALEEVKEYTDNIMYSTYPHIKLQQILSHTEWNKKQQERLWKGVILQPSDFLWFNWLAQEIGYLLDIYHIQLIPKVFDNKKKPMFFTHETDGSINRIGETDMSDGEMRGILEQRKVLQARVYHKGNIWHCFYFTFRGLAGAEPGVFGGVPHYHYLSDKYGISRDNLNECIYSAKMPSSEVHIQINRS